MTSKPTHPGAAAGRALFCLLILALVGGPAPGRAAESKEEPPVMQATLEVLRSFTYAGDPLMVRLAVFNTGDKPWPNSKGVDLLGGLRVSESEGRRVSLKAKGAPDPKEQPAVIGAGGFFGLITDIQPLAADLGRPGVYTLTWEADGVRAPAVSVKVIPRFEPGVDYVAVLETDFGYMEFNLLGKEAPKHVQNFYDLAHQGFYNGCAIHMVMKGVEFRGGDASTSPVGRPFYTLEQEIAGQRKHQRGTLSMMRIPGTNLDDGSQFLVTLGPTPQYDGTLSIFGELRAGEETMAAIEAIPTTGRTEAPLFRPLRPVVVRSVTVKKAGGSGGTGGAR